MPVAPEQPTPRPAIRSVRFGDILRMPDVVRFHSAWPRRAQNLAEHSYTVAMLAMRLGYEVIPSMEAGLRLAIFDLALVHDMPETKGGDIPSPTKWQLQEATGIRYDEVMDRRFWEDRASGDPWQQAPELAVRLVRVADILEACLFYMRHGDREDLTRDLVLECLTITAKQLPGLVPTVYELLERAGASQELLQSWEPLASPAESLARDHHPMREPDEIPKAWIDGNGRLRMTCLYRQEESHPIQIDKKEDGVPE